MHAEWILQVAVLYSLVKQRATHIYQKFIAEKYGVSIDMVNVEFIIIKRIVWDKGDWPAKWIQRFEPPSANVSINRIFNQVDLFISEGFNKDGSYNTETTYEKLGVNNKCKWCEFANSPEICDKGKKWYQ